MSTYYKVELIAHAYESPITGRLDKGWKGEFAEGDPKFNHFRNNPSFKVTSRFVPDPPPPAKEPEKKPAPAPPPTDPPEPPQGGKDLGESAENNVVEGDDGGGSDSDDSDLTEVTVAELGLNLPAETIANLHAAGLGYASEIAVASIEDLDAVKGVGLSTAERLIEEAKKRVDE